jgi:protein-S-isoprenylcysteine O-methyltransferase Ste14
MRTSGQDRGGDLGSRLPSLGPRGEGWLLGQLLLLVLVIIAPWDSWPPALAQPAQWLGNALVVFGVLIIVLGARELGSNLTPFPRPRQEGKLVESGIYRFIRHPIYVGLVVAALGAAVGRPSTVGLVLTVVLAIYLDLKARREEFLLSTRFPAYAAYRQRTRRFIPGLY